jgi:hypothetical protein
MSHLRENVVVREVTIDVRRHCDQNIARKKVSWFPRDQIRDCWIEGVNQVARDVTYGLRVEAQEPFPIVRAIGLVR